MLAAQTFVCVVKVIHATVNPKTVVTKTNALKAINQPAVSMPFVKISQVLMNVNVRLDSTATHSTFAKNATALNVSVNHHISWSAEIVFWPDAQMVISVQKEPNAFQLQAVSVIVPVQRVSELKTMGLALTLMNVLKTSTLADMTQFVLTMKVVILAIVHLVTMVNLIKVCVHRLNVVVPLIKNVALTRNAFNLENAFAPHLSLLMLAIFAETPVKDLLAVLMRNVVQLIHLNACVKQGSKETLSKVVYLLTSVQMHLVLMEHNVSLKKVATNASVQTECPVTHTKVDVSTKIQRPRFNAHQTMTVLQIFTAETAIVSVHAPTCCVEPTLFVNLRTMLDGAAAALDTLKDQMVIVFPVSLKSLLRT
jgi:hypothetical protein